MKKLMCLMSALLGLLLVLNCDGLDENEDRIDRAGAAGAFEEKIPCTDTAECDDQNLCTVDACYEGFCDYQSNRIDEDLDGYVSHVCGGPDCDDENEMIHPGIIEAPHGDEICSDGVDNDCNDLIDEEEMGCFRCEESEDCDDGNPCTLQACVEGRCAYTNNPGPCDDGDDCTMNDACFGGTCTGDPLDADEDGYVSDGCGGDDCDDALPEVHPGTREGPPEDSSCTDGLDNDCDGPTDSAELACQGDNRLIELTTEEELVPAQSDLEIAFRVGTFQGTEVVRVSYAGEVDAVYVPTEDRVWVEGMSLAVDPVSANVSLPPGNLTVEVEQFTVSLNDPEDVILDPEGYFTGSIRLRIEAIVSAHSINIEDEPLSLLSDPMNVSGRWIPRGDTDGDGLQEYDFLVGGAVSYGFPTMNIPIFGEFSATISGNVELGFRGEEF